MFSRPIKSIESLQEKAPRTSTALLDSLTSPTMLPRHIARPSALLRRCARPPVSYQATRSLVAAPKPGDGPLMERRSDRELPKPEGSRILRTLPIFILVISGAALAFFNYQKSSSPVVESALYALRVNPEARAALGDEVYFADRVPYIWGSIDQLHGKIDISFSVKGTKDKAMMTFRCERRRDVGWVGHINDSTSSDVR